MINIALADDHRLIRRALIELINRFDGFEVVFDAPNGKQFIECLQNSKIPDIALIDINMPEMDGFETTAYLSQHYPEIKTLALSVDENEESIIKMLRSGAKGYLLKDTDTDVFNFALNEVATKGYYHSELVSNTLLKSIKKENQFSHNQIKFQGRELEFLALSCSELTYKEIADRMNLSPRTIDGYRENLFIKLELKSRVGLVLFAIKNQLVKV